MPRRLEPYSLIFWSIPAAIVCVAGVFAWRAYRTPSWAPPSDSPALRLLDPCAQGRYRCRAGKVQATTGEPAHTGPGCVYKDVAACARGCVTEAVTLSVEESVARRQLCDPPKRPLALLSSLESLLDAPLSDAGMCEGDGYVPSSEGFVQCIRRSGIDPAAAGVVIARATCRAGAVPTLDYTPRLIKREEAAAVWCNRDPIAEIDLEGDAGDAGDSGDAR